MPLNTRIPPEFFPDSIHELADVIGLHPALALVKAYGGTRLEVPQSHNKRPDLVALIGQQALKALTNYYGGTGLDIPRCTKLMRLARDLAILKSWRKGLTHRQLAKQYNQGERNIRRATKRAMPHENQPWLDDLQALTPTEP